jgi:small conductance mechanosensitive channel
MNPQLIQAKAGSFLEGLTAWGMLVLPNLVAAALILLIGFWLSGRLARQVGHLFDGMEQFDTTLRGVLTSLVRYAILVIVFVAALSQLGVQTTSILAVLGAAGLAIGLALQGTLANVAAGVMLLSLRPFRVGDYIDTGNFAGTVKEVNLFATEMHTWDGIYQFVPNSELWNKRVMNYSRLATRLVQVKYGVAYGDDIGKAKSVLLALANGDERVMSDPEPQIFVSMLGDNAVELSLRVWAAKDDYWSTLRDLNETGKNALQGAGLTIPFPQLDVHHHGLNALPAPRES